MTSTWVRQVSAQRGDDVEWRFISLRQLNADVDYAAHFPPSYDAQHTAGLRLLRVAAKVGAENGRAGVAAFYEACGAAIFETDPATGAFDDPGRRGTVAFVEPILTDAGLPTELAAALDDTSFDAEIQASTDEALALVGQDVGTPIIQVDPPDGVAFFGPVISRRPSDEDALALWDHVVGLARFPGFAELKRSLRETPQLPGLRLAEAAASED